MSSASSAAENKDEGQFGCQIGQMLELIRKFPVFDPGGVLNFGRMYAGV